MSIDTSDIERAAVALASARSALEDAEMTLQSAIKRAISEVQIQNGQTATKGLLPTPTNGEGDSITKRIKNILDSDPAKEWSYDEISERIPGTTRLSVRALLYRLEKKNKAKWASRGHYKAVSPA